MFFVCLHVTVVPVSNLVLGMCNQSNPVLVRVCLQEAPGDIVSRRSVLVSAAQSWQGVICLSEHRE